MSFARRASSFPLPASGERVASADRREPGEGAFQKRSALRRRPLTRPACANAPAGRPLPDAKVGFIRLWPAKSRTRVNPSSDAGRGEAELAA